MVEVQNRVTDKVINGLEVILVDSIGNPYIFKTNERDCHVYKGCQYNTDTLRFNQNSKKIGTPKESFPLI